MANVIKISGSEPIEYGPLDIQLGDYMYILLYLWMTRSKEIS